jgi:hypothetical protein
MIKGAKKLMNNKELDYPSPPEVTEKDNGEIKVGEREPMQLAPDYWKRIEGDPDSFVMKEGAKPSRALKAAMKEPAKLDCERAASLVMYYGLMKALGKREFNRRFASGNDRMRIAPFSRNDRPEAQAAVRGTMTRQAHPLWKYFQEETRPVKDPKDSASVVSVLRPGDVVRIKNHEEYLEENPLGYWSGEWSIYTGEEGFIGHLPGNPGPHSYDWWLDLLATQSAPLWSGSDIPGIVENGSVTVTVPKPAPPAE